uniref:Transmembrane protein n=1 Tax=Chenopodium quinoa TaxID=63459 RepID=A0A803LKZ4_CHEQI
MGRFIVLISFMILVQMSSSMAVSRMQLLQRIPNPKPAFHVQVPASAPAVSSIGDVQHIRLVSRHHDIPMGGDVILGGFAFAFVAAIVCYIRVTRKDHTKNISPEIFEAKL